MPHSDSSANRKPGRRIPLLVLILTVLVLAALSAAVVWAFPVFRVATVEVVGNERVSAEAVRESLGGPEGENLLRVDTVAAAAAVVGDPWVREATVSRHLPGTLRVELVERTVIAYREEPEGAVLIDVDGTSFLRGVPPEGAVQITGSAAEEGKILAGAVDIAATLSAEVRAEVDVLEAESAHSYILLLRDGRRIHWGASMDNGNKALAMETVLLRGGTEWDISNPELVTVR